MPLDPLRWSDDPGRTRRQDEHVVEKSAAIQHRTAGDVFCQGIGTPAGIAAPDREDSLGFTREDEVIRADGIVKATQSEPIVEEQYGVVAAIDHDPREPAVQG